MAGFPKVTECPSDDAPYWMDLAYQYHLLEQDPLSQLLDMVSKWQEVAIAYTRYLLEIRLESDKYPEAFHEFCDEMNDPNYYE